MVYETEKFLKDNGDKISVRQEDEGRDRASQALKDALKGDDAEAIQKAERGAEHRHAGDFGRPVCAGQAGAARRGGAGGRRPEPPPPSNADGKADGDVIDADFEMVDDDKKNSK